MANSQTFIPATDPNIQYFGRWDFSDSLSPRHSWPGIYVVAKFIGKSIGARLSDTVNYYNVYIDGKLHNIFHGTKPDNTDYILADSLQDTVHTLRFSQRNISFGICSFSGLLLDSGDTILPPPLEPVRKIEFVGDSFTAAEGNEATEPELQWEAKFPVTDIDSGFATMVARHFDAQYHVTARSGIGMVCDWQGKFKTSMLEYFDRTLMESAIPKWDFKKWVPDLVVICLGLNDHSGLAGRDGKISAGKSLIFRQGYMKFIETLRSVYPGVPIIAWAPYIVWARMNTKEVVKEARKEDISRLYYSHFDQFPGGYVANGHPTAATHRKMANELIATIDSLKIFIR